MMVLMVCDLEAYPEVTGLRGPGKQQNSTGYIDGRPERARHGTRSYSRQSCAISVQND